MNIYIHLKSGSQTVVNEKDFANAEYTTRGHAGALIESIKNGAPVHCFDKYNCVILGEVSCIITK